MKNLRTRVEETLKHRVLNLEYPSNHIFTEEAVCLEFGVSRSPVREAFRSLESAGLIHKTANRSYRVRQISQNSVRELYETRLALERYIVDKLCGADYKPRLEPLFVYWRTLDLNEEKNLGESDRLFHEQLAEIYGNTTILEELKRINERLRVFREVDFSKRGRKITTQEQHASLLKALLKGDREKATEYIELNIREGMENALEALREAILRAYEK